MKTPTTPNSESEPASVIDTSKMSVEERAALELAEASRVVAGPRNSFAGSLFMGRPDFDPILPFPAQSDEDADQGDAFLGKLQTFLETKTDPDEIDATGEIPDEVMKGLAELGAFGIKIPTKYGGLGLSQTNYSRAAMVLGRHCGNLTALLSAHQSIGVPQPLVVFGTDAQKEKFLPRCAKGEISAFALTEPDVGSDPARMSTVAELSEDGTHYILNGEKLWCTNGTIADIIIVIARTASKVVKGKEKQQITAFILEMDQPGIEIVHRCEFMGLNGIYNGLLKFTNVKIPVEDRLGDEGRGLAMALDTINVGRLTLPAASAGVSKQCLLMARVWGEERVQWGKPIGLHEEGRKKLAEIASTTFAIEAVAWLTSMWADNETCDLRIEAAMAKLFTTEALWRIVDLTLQLRGGRGYEKAQSLKARGEPGFPVERAMRDCRINTILEGSTEIMRLFLAREAMDPHISKIMPLVKGKVKGFQLVKEIFKLAGHYGVWYPGQMLKGLTSRSYREMGSLAKHFKFIEKNAHKLARSIFWYMALYQEGLVNRQMILGRLVEIGTDLFVMAAVCSYARSVSTDQGGDDSPIALADYFSTLAEERVRGNFAALKKNNDRQMSKLGKRIFEKEMQWLEKGIIPISDK